MQQKNRFLDVIGALQDSARARRSVAYQDHNDDPYDDSFAYDDKQDGFEEIEPYRQRGIKKPDRVDTVLNRSSIWRFASGFIPKGYGTYASLAMFAGLSAASMLGISIPGFEAIEGNEVMGIVGSLVGGYFRRALTG